MTVMKPKLLIDKAIKTDQKFYFTIVHYCGTLLHSHYFR
jgi:hypothetical protein